MVHDHRIFAAAVLLGFLVVGLLAADHGAPAEANEVLTWNETAAKVVAANG